MTRGVPTRAVIAVFALVAVLLASAVSVAAAPVRADGARAAHYKRYENPRFKFVIFVPRAFSSGRPYSNNTGAGASWHNNARTASVFAAGFNNTTSPRTTSKDQLLNCEDEVHNRGGTVTYRHRSGNVAVCSGTYGRSIWYAYAVTYRQTYYVIWWHYRAKIAKRINPLVRHSVGTFEPGLRHFA